jgi:hypothetical protein
MTPSFSAHQNEDSLTIVINTNQDFEFEIYGNDLIIKAFEMKFVFLGGIKKATKSKSDKNIVLNLIKRDSSIWDSFLMNGALQKFLRVKNLIDLDEKFENDVTLCFFNFRI